MSEGVQNTKQRYLETDMTAIFARFLKDESGATAIEYGLIASLIALAIVTGATALGGQISTTFTNIGTKLKGSTPTVTP
jgi:pilus assembly protein Flp/PilA